MLAYFLVPTALYFAGFEYLNKPIKINKNAEAKIISQAKSDQKLENLVFQEPNTIRINNSIKENSKEQSKENYEVDKKNKEELRDIIYARAANQPSKVRQVLVKMYLNRVGRPDFPKTLEEVLEKYEKYPHKSKDTLYNKRQTKGWVSMNEYDKKTFDECMKDVEYVLSGKKIGIKNEEKIIEAHNAWISYDELCRGENKQYWRNKVPAGKHGNLNFYIDLRDEKIPSKPPYFKGKLDNDCSKYVRKAGAFYGWEFSWSNAWNVSRDNKLITNVNGSLWDYENSLVPKKSAVTFLFLGSGFRYLKDKKGNYILKNGKRIERKVTHVALYVGKDNNNLYFIDNAGESTRVITYNKLKSKGYIAREIVEPLRAIGERR
jgi:hypothetical protein